MRLVPTFRNVWCVSCLLLVPLLAGCGGTTTSVSGQVLLDGNPLPGGIVTFAPVDGTANLATATIKEDGTFEMANAPIGPVRVAIDNRALKTDALPRGGGSRARPPEEAVQARRAARNLPDPAPAEKMPGTYVPFPNKYLKAETSGLTLAVKRGDGRYSIELTSH
jgi:hypothetical protein